MRLPTDHLICQTNFTDSCFIFAIDAHIFPALSKNIYCMSLLKTHKVVDHFLSGVACLLCFRKSKFKVNVALAYLQAQL